MTGQDGSYLAEFLLEKGYQVHGLIRRSSSFNTKRIDHIINNKDKYNNFYFHYGDMTDASNLNRILEKIEPDEIYNLAAQSHVKVSFEIPDYTAQVDALGTLRFLDAIRESRIDTKFYQASTSELYGKVMETPQNELTHIQGLHMALQNYIHIGLLLITEKLMIYLLAMAYYLIMKVPGEVKLLLQEKLL